ncbi:fatty acyl-AMP ligase [Streptomyces sp. AJS327]|uniref:AMP-binding protein n=1 Tax=Streptomyces sp. AJS327 TaxID=2545265 RepID=UPI0015DFA681|nr:AMP-binding protein [Streptomyces sp. AJS327]MBA0052706.1 fatty acyl-AMP ligase [Streptomyces sp. AJS327]
MFAKTLHETLDSVAERRPTVPVDFPSEKRSTTLGELAEDSRRMARALTGAGVEPGDRLGVLCQNEPDFLVALFAAARLGCAACPLPIPTGPKDVDAYLGRLGRVSQVAGMRHLVLSASFASFGEFLTGALPGVAVLSSDLAATAETSAVAAFQPPTVEAESTAIVQFTSGSTADPKGVELSHANILACLEAISVGIELGDEDSLGMWLPLFHDMGLFATLSALFAGIPATVWSPLSFVKRPGGWLREFAASGATISTSPDFGYGYLTDAVTPEEAAALDLSRWRIAFNGAETIRRDSVDAFLERFAPAGFRPGALMTVYGMAEATLAVNFPPLGREPVWDVVDRDRLSLEGVAVPVEEDDPTARAVASVGPPVRGMEVRVCATDLRETRAAEQTGGAPALDGVAAEAGPPALPDGRVGEVLIRGASVTRGYLTAEADPRGSFTAGWLHTGDVGYTRDGELYVTGRLKEMIVVRGDNYYPQDVEELGRAHPGVYKERCVAYADTAPDGSERIVLAAESREARDEAARAALEKEMREHVSSGLGLDAVLVRVVPPRTLPRTTSGKFQRLAARKAVEEASG